MRILRYSGGGVVRLPFEEPRRRAYIAGRTASEGSGNGTREDRVSEFGGEFSARTDAEAERANRKSAVREYADVPWAELADRAEKAAMLPKAEEVRSNR